MGTTRPMTRRWAASVPTCLLLLALGACQRPAPKLPPQPASRTAAGQPAPVASSSDPRMERFLRVDLLVSRWDVAQAASRTEEAAGLFAEVRSEVDGAFSEFLEGSRGRYGRRFQYVSVGGLGFSARPESTRAILEALTVNDAQLVGNALIALKLRADPTTPLGPLLKLVASGAPETRRYAPLALANVIDARWRTGRPLNAAEERAVTQALSSVVANRDPFVRLHAAKALAALRTPAAHELLMILVRDDRFRVRLAAAAGLERIGKAEGFPEVVRLLADASDDMRPIVRDVLASYAERLETRPLQASVLAGLDTSPTAWQRWFSDYLLKRGITLDSGRAAGAPPGAARTPPAAPETPPTR